MRKSVEKSNSRSKVHENEDLMVFDAISINVYRLQPSFSLKKFLKKG
jgi:TnpA family transposase